MHHSPGGYNNSLMSAICLAFPSNVRRFSHIAPVPIIQLDDIGLPDDIALQHKQNKHTSRKKDGERDKTESKIKSRFVKL